MAFGTGATSSRGGSPGFRFAVYATLSIIIMFKDQRGEYLEHLADCGDLGFEGRPVVTLSDAGPDRFDLVVEQLLRFGSGEVRLRQPLWPIRRVGCQQCPEGGRAFARVKLGADAA